MGETTAYQPLTQADKISVVVYRTGIVVSALVSAIAAYLMFAASSAGAPPVPEPAALSLLLTVQASVGLSVFFIHLYMGNLSRYLKIGYAVSLVCLAALLAVAGGDLTAAFVARPYLALLLVPVSACLGFITAKEAYCFHLMEGYVLAVAMPAFLVLCATGLLPARAVAICTMAIATLLVLFTVRKVFMPLHYDIGDKTAYS